MCRFYTAGCGNKMVVSVTGPRAVRRPSHTGYVYSTYVFEKFKGFCNICSSILEYKFQIFFVRYCDDVSL